MIIICPFLDKNFRALWALYSSFAHIKSRFTKPTEEALPPALVGQRFLKTHCVHKRFLINVSFILYPKYLITKNSSNSSLLEPNKTLNLQPSHCFYPSVVPDHSFLSSFLSWLCRTVKPPLLLLFLLCFSLLIFHINTFLALVMETHTD